MEYEIVKASNVAKRAMRKANRREVSQKELMQRKKYAMRQYRKSVNARRKVKMKSIDQDYSKYIEYAILATIALAVLSVSHPQVGVLALIFAVLIVAAIMDTKIKDMKKKQEKSQKENEAKMEKMLRMVRNEHKEGVPVIEVKPRRSSVLEKTIHKLKLAGAEDAGETKTFTEFPYRNIN